MVSSRNRRFGGGGIRRGIRSRRVGKEVPLSLGQPLAAWWRTDEGWDGNIWTDKVAGYQADGTGHAPTTTTLNVDHTVLRFDGSSQYLKLSSDVAAFFAGDYTVTIAYRQRTGTGNQWLFCASDSGGTGDYNSIFTATATSVYFRHTNSFSVSDVIEANESYGGYNVAMAGFEDSGDSVAMRVNGTDSTGTHTQDLAALDQGAIGVLFRGVSTLSGYAAVDIAEICVFDGKLSSADMATLQEYFDARYDIWRKIEALPNLVAAWDPRRGKTLGTGVSDWGDVVNSYTVSQATGTKQPTETLVSSAVSGCPALTFASASSQLLENTGFTALDAAFNNDAWTMVSAFRHTTLAASQAVCSAGAAGFTRSAAMYTTASGTLVNENLDPTFRQAVVSSFASAGTDYWVGCTSELALDARGNGTPATASPGNLTLIDTFTIGARNYNAVEDRYMDGPVYAVLAFDTEMVATSIDTDVAPLLDDLMGL